MFKAAIFDLDGTLVDSVQFHVDSFFEVCRRHRIPVEKDFIVSQLGAKTREIFGSILALSGRKFDLDVLVDEKYAEFMKRVSGVRPLPGAAALLSGLKSRGIKIAVATGARRMTLDSELQYAALPDFNAYVSADDVKRGKPSPDVFLKAAELLSVSPAECVVLEDAVLGIRAAKNAGMRAVAVPTGLVGKEVLALESPDLIISSLSEATFNKLAGLFS